MSEHCGSVSEDGSAVCMPGQCSCSSESENNALIQLSMPSINKKEFSIKEIFVKLKKAISSNHQEKNHVEENS